MNFNQIKEDLDLFSEWEDRYGYIIDLGKQISLPDEKKTDDNKVNGCASQVWLDMKWDEPNNTKVFIIEGDSDALIVKGLIAILLSLYQGKTLVQAQAVDPRAEFDKLGLNSHLSSQRSNGLKSMIDQIKIFVNTYKN
tara:strand:- start:222 stop:635 length:414 start_codon:yes stop_codon:yes gene_type:complete